MHRSRLGIATSSTLLILALAACGGGSGGSNDTGTPVPPSAAPSTRFDLANRCFSLQSLSANAFAAREGAGYTASSTNASGAEPFYMKPTALGEYLFHARDKSLLAASGSSVTTVATASSAANWIINTDPNGGFTVTSESTGQALTVDPNNGRLILAATGGLFKFVPATGCTAYPEISTDTVGETYKGRGVSQPVVGFAEVHTHMAMGHEMSDGKNPRGPSAGGAMYGQMFHRFGVPHALEDCAEWHGPDGTLDPEAAILDMTPLRQHDTQGWPTFIDWPARDSQLHQAMYYKWVERAWKAGLRILVSEGTNIEALCEVAKTYEGTINPTAASTIDCNDMNLGINQVKYLIELQDYVDAQEGGPGKGWFRIVKDPFEARAVINDGKLAVVPGLEFANLFRCTVVFDPLGNETHGCSEADIDRQIEEVWNLGVRELFPYHDVNSALGGTGIFDGFALNLVGFYGTRRFWETYDCPDGGEGDSYFYNAGAIMTTAIPGTGSDPISQAIIPLLQGPAPAYPPDRRQCNARGLVNADGSLKQDRYAVLGRYTLQKLMEKKFIIDIDHAELSIKQYMIDVAKKQNPAYPLISAHGGHGGISMQQARDILAIGGLIYPFHDNGRAHTAFVGKLQPLWTGARGGEPIAVGFGVDANGIANRAGARGMGSTPVAYPFTLFQGTEWNDPMFAGLAPVKFDRQTIPESQKTWDVNEVSSGAHYGMIADFVEEVRIEGGKDALKALYQSAEAYLQMWEQTVCRGANQPIDCPG